MHLSRVIAGVVVPLFLAGAFSGLSQSSAVANGEFVGSIPADEVLRRFVGGFAPEVPCHCVSWRLRFSPGSNGGGPARFALSASYGLQGRADTNQLEVGPTVEVAGVWEVSRSTKGGSNAVVYRLVGEGRTGAVSLVRVGENILHFLNEDGSFRVGNAGWSFTLSRTGVAVPGPVVDGVSAEESAVVASGAVSNYWKTLRPGPNVHGYFQGRSPCREISRLLGVPKGEDCIKIKWQLMLYRDPVTQLPTTFALGGLAWRNPPRTGRWSMVKGTKENPEAKVYQLDVDGQTGFLSFVEGDDNVLFFLGRNRELLVGDERFSYTLNRAVIK